jgi:hypothetical protein
VFSDTVHLTSFGFPLATYTPPPESLAVAEFPVITQSTITGLLDSMYTPPPRAALPPRKVKPSRRAAGPF